MLEKRLRVRCKANTLLMEKSPQRVPWKHRPQLVHRNLEDFRNHKALRRFKWIYLISQMGRRYQLTCLSGLALCFMEKISPTVTLRCINWLTGLMTIWHLTFYLLLLSQFTRYITFYLTTSSTSDHFQVLYQALILNYIYIKAQQIAGYCRNLNHPPKCNMVLCTMARYKILVEGKNMNNRIWIINSQYSRYGI